MRNSPYRWRAADIIGGDAALDFVNTVSYWERDPEDRLGGPAGFARWALVAGLVDRGAYALLVDEIRRDAEGAAKIYAKADRLRRALWRIFSALAAGRDVAPADLAQLEQFARRARSCSALVQTAGAFERRWSEGSSRLERPLLAIALAAESLLEAGPLYRLHRCGGANCDWLFIDRSKNGLRRWCSMATCGNGAKARNFRARQKQATAGA